MNTLLKKKKKKFNGLHKFKTKDSEKGYFSYAEEQKKRQGCFKMLSLFL